jgi:hypothetical protein
VIGLPPAAVALQPLDTIAWTSVRNGYSGKLFRVEAIDDLADHGLIVSLVEVDPDDWDWHAPTDEDTDDDFDPQTIDTAAQAIQSFSVTGVTLTHDGARVRPAIRMNWNETDQDDVDGLIYQVRRTANGAVIDKGPVDSESFADGAFYITKGLVSATAYEVRARYKITNDDRDTTWTAWTAASTPTVKFKGTEVGDDEIDTGHLVLNAVTKFASAYTNGGINDTGTGDFDAQSVTITTNGGDVALFTAFAYSLATGSCDIALKRDGATVGTFLTIEENDQAPRYQSIAMADNPPAGTYTYALRIRDGGAFGGHDATISRRFLMAIERKR